MANKWQVGEYQEKAIATPVQNQKSSQKHKYEMKCRTAMHGSIVHSKYKSYTNNSYFPCIWSLASQPNGRKEIEGKLK